MTLWGDLVVGLEGPARIRVTAHLEDVNGNPLPGKPIRIYIDDSLMGTYDTDENGDVVAEYTVSPGTHIVKAEFPGDDQYEPSSAKVTVQVTEAAPPAPAEEGRPEFLVILLIIAVILLFMLMR